MHPRSRNHVGPALSDVAAVTLKRDANDFAVLHHGTAAVARVDLRADLDRQMLVNCRVCVELKINPRHDARRDGHPFSANWITIRRYGGLQRWDAAQF